jgi:hypothetical protein
VLMVCECERITDLYKPLGERRVEQQGIRHDGKAGCVVLGVIAPTDRDYSDKQWLQGASQHTIQASISQARQPAGDHHHSLPLAPTSTAHIGSDIAPHSSEPIQWLP